MDVMMAFHQVISSICLKHFFERLINFLKFLQMTHSDITPTGSLRRRRSRVLSEEDDNSLMDFLRSSANENSLRERKTSSYGSLDRSWARRARTGSNTKKRPELLNIDFSLERERPVSPANLEDARPRFVVISKCCCCFMLTSTEENAQISFFFFNVHLFPCIIHTVIHR